MNLITLHWWKRVRAIASDCDLKRKEWSKKMEIEWEKEKERESIRERVKNCAKTHFTCTLLRHFPLEWVWPKKAIVRQQHHNRTYHLITERRRRRQQRVYNNFRIKTYTHSWYSIANLIATFLLCFVAAAFFSLCNFSVWIFTHTHTRTHLFGVIAYNENHPTANSVWMAYKHP